MRHIRCKKTNNARRTDRAAKTSLTLQHNLTRVTVVVDGMNHIRNSYVRPTSLETTATAESKRFLPAYALRSRFARASNLNQSPFHYLPQNCVISVHYADNAWHFPRAYCLFVPLLTHWSLSLNTGHQINAFFSYRRICLTTAYLVVIYQESDSPSKSSNHKRGGSKK